MTLVTRNRDLLHGQNDYHHSFGHWLSQHLCIKNSNMKNVLVLTDFSKNAEGVAQFGIKLGSKLKANLLLFNTYVTNAAVPFVNEPWVANEVIWGDDDSRDSLTRLATQLKQFMGKLAAADYRPLIYCDNGEGRLGTVVPDIIERKNVELIVMGAREDDPDKDNLFGSDLNAVIQKSVRPILVTPPEADPLDLKKVIFATNFENTDAQAIQYLVKLGELLDFELEIVHVVQAGKNGTPDHNSEPIPTAQKNKLKYPDITYHHIRGENVVSDLLRICEESGAGMLAVVHHQHSFIGRIFHQSVTKKILNNRDLPLMIFPSRMV